MEKKILSKKSWYRIGRIYAVFIGLAFLFTMLAEEVMETETMSFDTAVLNRIHLLASPPLDGVILFITSLAGGFFMAVIILILAFAFYLRKEIYNTVYILLTLGGTLLLNSALKLFFKRARPDLWSLLVVEKSYSFPSGHAMVSMALALTLIVLSFNSRARWLSIALGVLYVLAIGFSRLYLGVHYPTDILGGWILSSVWIFLATRFMFRNTAFRTDTLT